MLTAFNCGKGNMYNKFTLARKFIHYYVTAANGKGHGIHSPFIYTFVRSVLNDRKRYYAYAEIEQVRRRLLKDNSVVQVQDLGAGSSVSKTNQRKVKDIARAALKPPKYAQLLFRIANFYQPKKILELGTSLGVTTAYLAAATPSAKIITIEGAPAIASKALRNFEQLDLRNITLVTGNFNDALQPALNELSVVDLAFVDGNHRKAPTLEYFGSILKHSGPGTIIIFDDIHWSAEMEEAWEAVKQHPAVTCTVDLFFIGLVFFRPEFQTRQHFIVRF
jgi:predicted O-methyltransferase YrrM